MPRNNGVALGVEDDRTHGAPVPYVARPACGMTLLGLDIQGIAGRQNGMVFAALTQLRRHVANTAVFVLDVVPVQKCCTPLARSLQRCKAFCGVFWRRMASARFCCSLRRFDPRFSRRKFRFWFCRLAWGRQGQPQRRCFSGNWLG